jgi:excisionase family DNA binding protein
VPFFSVIPGRYIAFCREKLDYLFNVFFLGGHMQKKFYTVEETAEIFRMHVETIRRGVREGRIPYWRLPGGRGIRIPAFFIERTEHLPPAGARNKK